jgi:hypothetical protein
MFINEQIKIKVYVKMFFIKRVKVRSVTNDIGAANRRTFVA